MPRFDIYCEGVFMSASTYVANLVFPLILSAGHAQTDNLRILVGIAETVVILNTANAWPGFVSDCHAAALAATNAGQPWQDAVLALIDRAAAMTGRA
jgi:hypothetical protein